MNQSHHLPIVGITMGDPLGIGPEILIKAMAAPVIRKVCRPLIIGDRTVLEQILPITGQNVTFHSVTTPEEAKYRDNVLEILELSRLSDDLENLSGPTALTGQAMQDYITTAVQLALKGKIQAIATCPITKTALKLAGSEFHGHTEMIASQTDCSVFSMMLAGSRLKVVLVTIHIPLSEVSQALTIEKIVQTIQTTHDALKKRFGMSVPRIAVAGLNPHAGEDAMFGDEEERLIVPAIKKAADNGYPATGPLPPDTVFFKAAQNEFDAVVCMYHDQGLIPFKLIHFKDGVNTTLGLPIIRTSVDHGTAYDIAGKGIADPSSLIEAVKMAAFQAENQKTGDT